MKKYLFCIIAISCFACTAPDRYYTGWATALNDHEYAAIDEGQIPVSIVTNGQHRALRRIYDCPGLSMKKGQVLYIQDGRVVSKQPPR